MKEELYQKEIRNLTQDELYEILLDCGISSVQKVEHGQGKIIFLDDVESKEKVSEMEDQPIFTYYEILILKNNRVGYKLSCSVQSFTNYTFLNDYKVA